ncbi:402_t:CDS:2, partial [Gigaspora rosea]
AFSGHLTDSVKNRFNEKNTNMAVIPEGLTKKLQPLDVYINKSFKDKYRKFYLDWMSEEIKKLTRTGPEWVIKSWNQVDPALIKRSFKCCGISTAQDGTEEDLMFNYDWVNNPEA